MRAVLPFFFSSRRRHTRSKRDWSSDVCSSDLIPNEIHRSIDPLVLHGALAPDDGPDLAESRGVVRSEERRVGKECRYRWMPKHHKKNQLTYTVATTGAIITL